MHGINELLVTEITEARTIIAYAGKTIAMLDRECCGLSFCKRGKITYTHNGSCYISDRDCAIFLPQGATYTLYDHFDGEFPLINFRCVKPLAEGFAVVPIKSPSSYFRAYEQLKESLADPEERLRSMSVFYGILGMLSNEGKSLGVLEPAKKYIADNLCRPELSVSDIADSLGVSECWLRRLFLRELSVTPKRYVTGQRIALAEALLSETRAGVLEISEKSGFSSVYHFCRAFKEYTDITPTEYRQSHTRYEH